MTINLTGVKMGQKIKKSDKVEQEAKLEAQRAKDPSLFDVWVGVYVNKALIKSVKDNDIPHLWKVVLIILAFVLGMGFTVAVLALKVGGIF